MKTPHLNRTIKYLKEFISWEDKDSTYLDIDSTKQKLEEYEAIKEALSIHNVSQRTYFFDCWNVGGKTFTKEIEATCKEHAILKFEKEYDSFGYDEPYVG